MTGARRPSVLAATLCLCASGCMALTPQLPPTEYAKIEATADRAERERLLKENWVFRHEEPQGARFTKGQHPMSTKRSWQSLDVVLRSDRNSSDALPYRELRRSRIFAALTAVSALLFIAGGAATARTGFDFKEFNGGNAILLGGALASVGFAVAAGVYYRRAQTGYERAVNIYNDSLGMRLGLLTPNGDYIPGENVAVDAEGYILTEDATTSVGGRKIEGPSPLPPLGQPASPPGSPPTTQPQGAPLSNPSPEPAPPVAPQPAPPAQPSPPGVAPQTATAPAATPRPLALLPAR